MVIVIDVMNLILLTTSLRHPDLSSYRQPDGSTHYLADAYSTGWYRAQGEQLEATVKTLLSEVEAKDKEIERLTALLAR
jgi:hypothetical protein